LLNHINIDETTWKANSTQSNKVLLSEISNLIQNQLLIDKATIDT